MEDLAGRAEVMSARLRALADADGTSVVEIKLGSPSETAGLSRLIVLVGLADGRVASLFSPKGQASPADEGPLAAVVVVAADVAGLRRLRHVAFVLPLLEDAAKVTEVLGTGNGGS